MTAHGGACGGEQQPHASEKERCQGERATRERPPTGLRGRCGGETGRGSDKRGEIASVPVDAADPAGVTAPSTSPHVGEQVENLAASKLIVFINKDPTNDEGKFTTELGGPFKIVKKKAFGGSSAPLESITRHEDMGERRASSLASDSGGLRAHGSAQVGFTDLSIGGTSWHTVGRRIYNAKTVVIAAI